MDLKVPERTDSNRYEDERTKILQKNAREDSNISKEERAYLMAKWQGVLEWRTLQASVTNRKHARNSSGERA